jgi:DNA-binding winged helix-turn-helix (wHTH) protein/Tfp pilus assembly protein PilF
VINQSSKRYYEFDSFRIDVDERRLIRGIDPVPLTPKVFDVLLALVENRGRTLGKDELIERVWADTFVEDGNLNRNISLLRKILGEDSRNPHYIRTVPKRGYRFEADVREIIEEAEESRVERSTNYRLAISENTEVRTVPSNRLRAARSWAIPVGGAVLVILILASLWMVDRKAAHAADPAAGLAATGEVGNAEAYELYRKGRDLWQDRSAAGLHHATLLLEQATAREPNFALAHAALADAYAFDGGLWKKAEGSANEAIRLDPTRGEPHATLGFVQTFWHWQPRDADAHFKQAIALSPDYATAHQWYGINLAARAQIGAALAEMQRAVQLDPAAPAINADLCHLLYFARKYDAAIEQCNKTLNIDPNFLSAHEHLYEIYTAKGMYAEAVESYFAASRLNMTMPVDPSLMSSLRPAYDTGGIEAFWRTRIKMLTTPVQTTGYSLAKYHARLGETELAIRWLTKARQGRDFEYILFVADPVFESLAADPRYIELRNEVVN